MNREALKTRLKTVKIRRDRSNFSRLRRAQPQYFRACGAHNLHNSNFFASRRQRRHYHNTASPHDRVTKDMMANELRVRSTTWDSCAAVHTCAHTSHVSTHAHVHVHAHATTCLQLHVRMACAIRNSPHESASMFTSGESWPSAMTRPEVVKEPSASLR